MSRATTRQLHKCIAPIPAEAMEALVHYDWPGNVRELQNVMERGVILAANGVLRPQVPTRSAGVRRASPRSDNVGDAGRHDACAYPGCPARHQLGGGRPHGAATRLGLKRTTLLCRMAKLGRSISRCDTRSQG